MCELEGFSIVEQRGLPENALVYTESAFLVWRLRRRFPEVPPMIVMRAEGQPSLEADRHER